MHLRINKELDTCRENARNTPESPVFYPITLINYFSEAEKIKITYYEYFRKVVKSIRNYSQDLLHEF